MAELETVMEPEMNKMSLRDRIDLAKLQEFEATMDPATGTVPRERLMHVYDVILEQERNQKRGKAAIGGTVWQERGPNNVGGRTRCLIFDAADATNKTVFAGSVAGGLFKTTDIFATNVEWTAVNDTFGNMAVTSLAQDPSNSNILYMGTGEGFFNYDAVRGDGIWKSTDGGANWFQLSSTTGNSFSFIHKIIVDDAGNVIVGAVPASSYSTDGGVYRSTNGGTTFTRVLNTYSANTELNTIADVELAADGKTYFASNGLGGVTDGIYKSTDSAKTWTRVYDADDSSERRIDLVCAPSNVSYIYALVQGSGNAIKKIMKSIDGGTTWTSCQPISWLDQCSSSSSDFTRNQAWYNLASAVDPSDEKILYVGGINMFRTTDTGTTWSQLSSWVGCGGYSEVHSDHHVLLFYPGSSDTLVNGNDGGVYITKNAQSSPPTWSAVNGGFNVTQFYAGAIHPTALSHYFLTGSQDNGSQRFQAVGINSTDEVTGGDGGYCHIDQLTPDTQITAYTYDQIRISTNGFTSYTTDNESTGNFINASDYDSDNKILYSAHNADTIYRRSGIGGTITGTKLGTSTMGSSQASAILVSTHNSETVWVGTEGGRVVRIYNANGTPTYSNMSTGLPSGTVSCIAMDHKDSNHLLVTYSNYGLTSVWESTDYGSSWSSVEGDLPDMPVRWALFSPIGGDSVMLATEVGVWSTTNLNSAGTTNWNATNTGLANCRVDMLQYRASDSLVMAATHGRGVYTTRVFSNRLFADFGADKTVTYTGNTINFYDDSYGATSWSWDFDGDGIAESTEQNPSYAYGEGGFHTVILTINGSLSKTRTDYIQILPNQPVPYTAAMGGNMETNTHHFGPVLESGSTQLWERGAPSNHFTTSNYNGSNAWVTDLDADITETNTQVELWSPCFNFTSTSSSYTVSFVRAQQTYWGNAPAGGKMYYSTDRGASWTQLGSSSSGGTNWYASGKHTSLFSDGDGWISNTTKATCSHDVSFLNGNASVCFKIVYKIRSGYCCPALDGYAIAGMVVDDFTVSGPANDSITGAGIENSISEKTLALPGNDSATFYSPSGKVIAKIWNNSSHNFGNTKVEIDAAGTTPTDFDTNTTAEKKIFGKTIRITPTSNSSSADVKIAMYFTEAELTAWKAASGLNADDVALFKTTNSIGSSTIAQGVEPSATELDSAFDGSNVCVTGTFSNGFSGVGGGGGANGGGPVPVTLLDFEGQRFDREVLLNWSTASETNNSHFDIERSVDGEQFTKIGRVNGHGNSTSILEYLFMDQDNLILQNNTLCYRLRQVDFDGAYEIGPIVCLDKDQIRIDLSVGPNPVSKVLNVAINPWLVDLYTIEMMDMNGKIMYQRNQLEAENSLDVSDLPSGIYFVNIKKGDASVYVEKLIKE